MGSGFEYNLLGPLEVARNGVPVPVPGAKQRTLLAALLLEANRVVSGERLIARLWEDDPPANARNALQNHVKRLRQVLIGGCGPGSAPDPITTRPDGYLIAVPEQALDVSRFTALVRRAESAAAGRPGDAVALYGEALAQWRGEPLGEISSALLHGEFGRMLTERRLAAVEARIELELRLGRHDGVLAELAGLTAAQPLRERFWEQRMLALYRSGRQAEALTAYQSAAAVLAEELGVDPGTTLRGLHQAILTDAPALRAPAVVPVDPAARDATAAAGASAADPGRLPMVPRQLPAAARGFRGRARELGALTALAAEADSAQEAALVVVITGTAGIGKTSLAVQWAHRMAGRFPDGQLYVNLRGYDPAERPVQPEYAIRGFLDAFGIPPKRIPATPEAQAGLYRSIVAGRRALVVLDNAHDAEQVRPLLPTGPGCLTVITSRRELASLVAIEGAQPVELDLLPSAEARELLTARLGTRRTAAEPDAVDQIIERCARLPLALALAAARAAIHPGLTLGTIAAQLREGGAALGVLDGGDAASDVRTVFSWSYRQLEPGSARLFRLLGLHPGPDISPSAAASLAAVPVRLADALLADLAAAHLITEHVAGRFALHDLLRAYAAELAATHDPDEDRRDATHRMLDHYVHTSHLSIRRFNPNNDPLELPPVLTGVEVARLEGYESAMTWCTDEDAVVRAAVASAVDSGFDVHAWQLALGMEIYFNTTGRWHEGLSLKRAALAAAQRLGDLGAQARIHRSMGMSHAKLTAFDQAFEHLRLALELHGEVGYVAGQAHVHENLAWLYDQQGDPRAALEHLEQAFELFGRAGHRSGQAAALNGVGWCHTLLGEHRQALDFCGQALELQRELGDRAGEAHSWDSLGHARLQLGEHAEALACYERALELFQELGERYYKANTLTHLGDVHEAAGDRDAALGPWKRALAILEQLDHPAAHPLRAKLES